MDRGCLAIAIGMLCIPWITAGSESAAAGGRISFVGAIVEPTCSASTVSIGSIVGMPTSDTAVRRRFACGNPGITSDSGRFYSLAVANLDAVTINHDRMLEYFADYMKAAGNSEKTAKRAVPVLITQTYE